MKTTLSLLAVIASLQSSSVLGQTETPLQNKVEVVTEAAPAVKVKANIVPLFWKANINDSTVTIPLRNIEFFGIQDFVVDGATRVRELTISNGSRNLVRIYHIAPLVIPANTLSSLRNRVEERILGDEGRPVKVFPDTTHAQMVEYRVTSKKHIDRLFKHLESAMIEYHARTLVPEQRLHTVREVSVCSLTNHEVK